MKYHICQFLHWIWRNLLRRFGYLDGFPSDDLSLIFWRYYLLSPTKERKSSNWFACLSSQQYKRIKSKKLSSDCDLGFYCWYYFNYNNWIVSLKIYKRFYSFKSFSYITIYNAIVVSFQLITVFQSPAVCRLLYDCKSFLDEVWNLENDSVKRIQ